MAKIRIRIAGLYIRENKVLVVKHQKQGRSYFLLPGGGQEAGESQKHALIREWQEELGVTIEVGDFLFLGESVPPVDLEKSQVLQITFAVKSIEGTPKINPDPPLVDFTYLDLNNVGDVLFFPDCIDQIQSLAQGNAPLAYSQYRWLT